MIRRVNAVLGWEASKEINSKTTRCPQNGALARGLLDLPTRTHRTLRTGCDKLVAVDYIYIYPTNAPPILEMAAAAAKTSSNYEIIRQIWGSVTGK